MNKERKKILTIYGSPRKGGNTDELMLSFERGVIENSIIENEKINGYDLNIERIYIRKMRFSPCIECRHCSIDGECSLNDDMQEAYSKLIEADFIAVSSPIFFISISAYLKAFIDRCQRFWSLKYEHKKRIINKDRSGIFISTAGSESEAIFECAKKIIKEFFNVLYVRFDKNFLYNNVDYKGDVLKKPKALDEVFEYGKKLSYRIIENNKEE